MTISLSDMRVLAVILAAGEGRRMGGPKALLRLGEETFLARAARLLGAHADGVVAVLGCEASRVAAEAGVEPAAQLVVNQEWRGGMLGSALLGLGAAEAAGADAILLHPVDQPLIAAAVVARVVAALRAGARVAVPSWADRRGHPAGFARAAWPALRAAPPAEGARAVLRAHPEWIVYVEGDEGSVASIDTPADYARWVSPSGPAPGR